RSQRGDERLNFVVAEDFIEAGTFGVEDLTAQRQDRLEVAVTSLLGGAACRVTFYDVKLGLGRVTFGAVCQFTGQGQRLEGRLADDEVTRLASRITRTSGSQTLGDDS